MLRKLKEIKSKKKKVISRKIQLLKTMTENELLKPAWKKNGNQNENRLPFGKQRQQRMHHF